MRPMVSIMTVAIAVATLVGKETTAYSSVPFRMGRGTMTTRQTSFRPMVASDLEKDPRQQENNKSESLQTATLDPPTKSPLDSLVGVVDDDRLAFPELSSGEVPRVFSSLEYTPVGDGKVEAKHASGSTLGAASLVAGTTVGAGILALPTATAGTGFVASSLGMTAAWFFMASSGLLVAELSLNRFGQTGRPGLGILDLYESSLGKTWGLVGSAAYFFLHYAMMVAYVAQGGANLAGVMDAVGLDTVTTALPGIGQLTFVMIGAVSLYIAEASLVEKVNNILVLGVFASFLGILGLGVGSADFGALVDPVNQHPENVVGAFPILFLALVYQNVVPTVVTQLEGDRTKIQTAIMGGITLPFLMFLAWNAVILGNVLALDSTDASLSMDPVAMLQSGANGPLLSTLVSAFSELALITSLIGFVYGLIDALTDVTDLPMDGPPYEKWKPALFAGVFVPPLALSVANPDIFYRALDYGGAFGVSTLFLLLPPFMVWKQRYGEDDTVLTTKPLVPFGKVTLGSMGVAASVLVSQQAFEKFGLADILQALSS